MTDSTLSAQDEARRKLADQIVPQVYYSLACGKDHYDCIVHAENLSFEEDLEFTQLLGKFIVERRKLIRALPAAQGGGE